MFTVLVGVEYSKGLDALSGLSMPRNGLSSHHKILFSLPSFSLKTQSECNTDSARGIRDRLGRLRD